ncbi:MAG: GxxExxY protein [bacterium]
MTKEIIAASFDVINELDSGFLEKVYENSLALLLRERGFQTDQQVPLIVKFRNHEVGTCTADLIVAEKVLVELKSVKNLLPEHSAQVINYLKVIGLQVGLLINFGSPILEYKRFYAV